MMNSTTNQSWTDEYLQLPSSCQDVDWLADINEVSKFDDRNVGHHNFLPVLQSQQRKELKAPSIQIKMDGSGTDYKPDLKENVNMRYTDVRERNKQENPEKSNLEKIGARLGSTPKPDQVAIVRGRGRGVRGKEAMRKVGGGISQMVFSHMGRAHRLHKEERSFGVGSGISAKLSSSDGQDELWNPFLDQDDDLSEEVDKMWLGK